MQEKSQKEMVNGFSRRRGIQHSKNNYVDYLISGFSNYSPLYAIPVKAKKTMNVDYIYVSTFSLRIYIVL